MLTRLKRDCQSMLALWSLAGLCYGAAELYLNNQIIPRELIGLVLLVGLASLWGFYRRLCWADGYLTRYDKPTKEKT